LLATYIQDILTPIPFGYCALETPFDSTEICSILNLSAAMYERCVHEGSLKRSVRNVSRPSSNFSFPNFFDIVEYHLCTRLIAGEQFAHFESQVAGICLDSCAHLLNFFWETDPIPIEECQFTRLLSDEIEAGIEEEDILFLSNGRVQFREWHAMSRVLAMETKNCWNFCMKRAAICFCNLDREIICSKNWLVDRKTTHFEIDQ